MSKSPRILVVSGSVIEQPVEAIVNAANTKMRGGGGLDGAIHRAAGRGLLQELERVAPDGSVTGEAVWTGAHNLPFKGIIHVAGPFWNEHRAQECDRLLVRAYTSALEVAVAHDVRSIGLPSISTGIYRFPLERAAKLAVDAVWNFLENPAGEPIESVLFAMFGVHEYEVFEAAVSTRGARSL